MMPDYRHAGTFWPANAGGEHPNVDTILGLPGSGSLVFVVADSARYWWPAIKARADLAVWRGLPRPDRLPAHLGWDARKVAAECVNLWDEPTHSGTEWFTPLNELQFRKESGEDWKGYADMTEKLSRLRLALRAEFGKRGQDVRLLFPAWVPGDDLDDASLDEYLDEACQWDGIRLHAYNNAHEVRARYWALRKALDDRHWGGFGRQFPILVDETNANHTGADERAMVQANAEICRDDPYCLGFCWYIWETNNAGEHDLSIWGNPDRYALFRSPPVAVQPAPEPPPVPVPAPPEEPPVPDYRQIARADAVAAGINPDYFERQIDQESGFNPNASNPSGATGIAQIIARWHPDVDPTDPIASLAYAANLVAAYLRQFGSYPKALAAYNWGSGNVGGYTKADGTVVPPWDGRRSSLPPETRQYLDVILGPTWEGLSGDAPAPTRVAFNADEPAHAQEESFDCSQEALEWALFAVGRCPSDDWLENTMIDEGVMSKADGLLDATGKGLADFVTRQYGEFGFYANNEPSVTFDAVANEIGPYPLLIGGRGWGHWSGCRGYDKARDVLLLANPADGWMGVHQTMTREQWDALGPFSMVRVLHPDLVPAAEPAPPAPEPAPAPPPAPEPAPPAMTLADVRARLLAIQDEITALLANLPAA